MPQANLEVLFWWCLVGWRLLGFPQLLACGKTFFIIPCHGCFSRLCTQGCAVTAFNHLTAQICVVKRQGLSSSVCQMVARATLSSTTIVYQQCWKEWVSHCVQDSIPNNAISAPKLVNVMVHLFRGRLAWYMIDIYQFAIRGFWNLIIITWLQIM